MVADGPPRQLGKSTVSIRWDLSTGAERADFDHTMLYPFPGQEKYTEIVTPDWGAVIDAKGARPMSGARLALSLRELERASPGLLLKALDHPDTVKALPNQKLGGKEHAGDLAGRWRARPSGSCSIRKPICLPISAPPRTTISTATGITT